MELHAILSKCFRNDEFAMHAEGSQQTGVDFNMESFVRYAFTVDGEAFPILRGRAAWDDAVCSCFVVAVLEMIETVRQLWVNFGCCDNEPY